jgi:hypothetical protein
MTVACNGNSKSKYTLLLVKDNDCRWNEPAATNAPVQDEAV